ncbi:hypothetical protein LX36DRAFT_732022 [Colletotrichum falcatum]|nr:hypothetical protein LX36DRAFT_732022 [Colletotrichum falcatum]
MQRHYLLSLLVLSAAAVLAAPLSIRHESSKYKRDLASIQAALNTINMALQGLDNSVKITKSITFGSGIQLLSSVGSVKNTIQDATVQVQASAPLNEKDSRNLKAATDALTNNVKVTINDIVAKKALVDNLGVTPLVAVALQDQKSASSALAQALVSKVPPELKDMAQVSATALSRVLDEGIGIFSGVPAAAPPPATTTAASDDDDAADDAAAAPAPRKGAGGGGVLGGLMQLIGGLLKR